MPRLNLTVPHPLERDAVLEKIRGLLEQVKSEHGDKISNLQEEWDDNVGRFSFSVMGIAVSGKMVVESHQVALDAKLPLAALPFRGRIKDIITEQAARMLT